MLDDMEKKQQKGVYIRLDDDMYLTLRRAATQRKASMTSILVAYIQKLKYTVDKHERRHKEHVEDESN